MAITFLAKGSCRVVVDQACRGISQSEHSTCGHSGSRIARTAHQVLGREPAGAFRGLQSCSDDVFSLIEGIRVMPGICRVDQRAMAMDFVVPNAILPVPNLCKSCPEAFKSVWRLKLVIPSGF